VTAFGGVLGVTSGNFEEVSLKTEDGRVLLERKVFGRTFSEYRNVVQAILRKGRREPNSWESRARLRLVSLEERLLTSEVALTCS